MKKTFLSLAFIISVVGALAQTTREEMAADLNKTGGVYYAYPVKDFYSSPAPEGYKPFYISHYGRHGSRYLISTNDYLRVSDALHKANEAGALTPLGIDVMMRVDSVLIEADGRGGDLSPLGVRQHRGIAERMYRNYPEVFADSTEISARSTLVVRCVLSMDAFSERLKELNPSLQITRESSQKYMHYLCFGSPESDAKRKELREEQRKFKDAHTNPDRIIASLFSDTEYVRKNVDPADLMWGLYWLASGMQDIETPVSFYDIFTPEELFDLWQVFNIDFYANNGPYAGNDGLMVENARNLLNNIIETADEALNSDKPSATLRFGHDGNLVPLAGILEFPSAVGSNDDLETAYEYFADYKVAPMAGNVQIVFFRDENRADAPVLVKFLLNEEEQIMPFEAVEWPYYDWQTARSYYLGKAPGQTGS